MKRLTTNKDISDIEGMYELAHNSCYIDKNGNARYRDFETDVDARILTRKLLIKYADGDDAFIDDDDFDNQMMDALQYGTDTREGLIALFYRNLWAMADLREKLKRYEDLAEQGRLIDADELENMKFSCSYNHNGIVYVPLLEVRENISKAKTTFDVDKPKESKWKDAMMKHFTKVD